MVGAGISTSAGIPDFRSPKTGLYNNLQKLSLPYAEAVFDIDFFKKNPKPFYLLSKELFPGFFKPTRFHHLIRLFEIKGQLQSVYTQNIDTLERIAGVSESKLTEAHGSFAKNHCIECHAEYSYEKFHDHIKKFNSVEEIGNDELILCEVCKKGLVKPDIVFFGEGLPERFFDNWDVDLEELHAADEGQFIAITAGTSLTVYPFASLPSEVPKTQRRVLVNMEMVGDFKDGKREEDLVFIESSDDFCDQLVEELGWVEEFNKLIDYSEEKVSKDAAEKMAKLISDDIEEELNREERELEADAVLQSLQNLKLEVDNSNDTITQPPSKP